MRRRSDFLAARRGERRGGPWFSLEVLDRGSPDAPPRLGLTVTKKVGNAVVRNRIRRRLREAVRTEVARDMAPGHDYVVVARAEVGTMPFEALVEALRQRVRQASGEGRGRRRPTGGRRGRRGAATIENEARPDNAAGSPGDE